MIQFGRMLLKYFKKIVNIGLRSIASFRRLAMVIRFTFAGAGQRAIYKAIFLPLLVIANSGCTRDTNNSHIGIQLPNSLGQATHSLQQVMAVGSSSWGLTDPTTIDEIGCYAVFIASEGLNNSYCELDSGVAGATGGILPAMDFSQVHGLFPPGTFVEVPVESGHDTQVYVVGFSKSSDYFCPFIFDSVNFMEAKFSAPFLLGTESKFISSGVAQDEIVVTVGLDSSSQKLKDCFGPNAPGGGDDGGTVGPVNPGTPGTPDIIDYTGGPFLFMGEAGNLVPTNTGGAVDSYTITPTLPAGLSLDAITGMISGTPTVNTVKLGYTVTATNTLGSSTFTLELSTPNKFNIDSFADSGGDSNAGDGICDNGTDCDLRTALEEVTASAMGAYHLFVGQGTIPLGSTLSITSAHEIHIVGDEMVKTIIDASGGNYRHIDVSSTSNVTLVHLRFISGSPSSGDGGAIHQAGGVLNIVASEFDGNGPLTGGGGAIYSTASSQLTIIKSSFTNNNVTSGQGGAILADSDATNLRIEDSIFDANTSSMGGGAIYTKSHTVEIYRSLISNSTAAGDGGALFFAHASADSGYAEIQDTTFYANSGYHGSIFYINSTVSYPVTFTNVTAVSNSGSMPNEIKLSTAANEFFIGNSILHTAGTICSVFAGASIVSLGSNISNEIADTCLLDAIDDLRNTDPLVNSVAPVVMGAGFMRAIGLQVGSPAIGAGDIGQCSPEDQYGTLRSDTVCSIGAVE